MYLRPARPADAEAIADVARESWHAAYGDFLSTVAIDETIDSWYAPADLREQVDEGAFVVAVDETESETRVVAFAHAVLAADGTRPTLARLYAREASGVPGSAHDCSTVSSPTSTPTRTTSISRPSSSPTTRSAGRSTRGAGSRRSAAGPQSSRGTTTKS